MVESLSPDWTSDSIGKEVAEKPKTLTIRPD